MAKEESTQAGELLSMAVCRTLLTLVEKRKQVIPF